MNWEGKGEDPGRHIGQYLMEAVNSELEVGGKRRGEGRCGEGWLDTPSHSHTLTASQEDQFMKAWLGLVNERNGLVRKTAELSLT